jgi:hypothetical protein
MKADKIIGLVEAGTAKWTKQRKAEERNAGAVSNRYEAMTYSRRTTIKDAAFEIMEEAYLKASGGGSLPAHARQIMYAARPYIQEQTGRTLNADYFTQQLLPEFLEIADQECADWNVAFDARGHFREPHTGYGAALGTIEIRNYLHNVRNHQIEDLSFNIRERLYPTFGPKNRYSAIFFIEKEGFMPLFEAVRLAERFDIAIMSTKGMSVTASRELVDELCSGHNIPLLVLHDFDKAGFSIVGTLKRDTRRYSFQNKIEVIDLGLRVGDIGGLQSESSGIEQKKRESAKWNLRENGATEEEIEFLLESRVELNAFASDELVAWIEGKLDEHGVKKVIPDDAMLADAYRRISEQEAIQRIIDKAVAESRKTMTAATVPDDLHAQIAEKLETDDRLTWDAALAEIIEEDESNAEEKSA